MEKVDNDAQSDDVDEALKELVEVRRVEIWVPKGPAPQWLHSIHSSCPLGTAELG